MDYTTTGNLGIRRRRKSTWGKGKYLPKPGRVLFGVASTIVFVIIGLFLGTLPGTLPAVNDVTYAAHAVEYNLQGNSIFEFYTQMIHYPYGATANEGFFMLLFTRLCVYMGFPPVTSLSLSIFCIYLGGFCATVWLIYRMCGNWWLSLVLTPLYYFTPALAAFSSVFPMFCGCLFLPVSVLLDFLLIERLLNEKTIKLSSGIKYAVLFTVLRLACCSIGWYTAVISIVISCLLVFFHCVRHYKKLVYWWRWLLFGLIPWAIGGGIITWIMPEGTTAVLFDESTYTASSSSILSLLLPADSQLLSAVIPSQQAVVPEGMMLSGSMTMQNNFIGLVLLACAIGGLVWRKADKRQIGLFIAAMGLLILSLGPYLRFTAFTPEKDALVYMVSDDSYVKLPWAFIYSLFPVRMMRAVNRWGIGIRLLLVLVGSTFISQLVQKKTFKRSVLAGIMVVLCFFEVLPRNIISSTSIDYYAQAKNMIEEIGQSLTPFIEEESKIIIIGPSNNYVSSVIASQTNSYSYNGSGDKAMLIARHYRPSVINKLQTVSSLEKIMEQQDSFWTMIKYLKWRKLCDYVVIPYFNPRYDVYAWPPVEQTLTDNRALAEQLAEEATYPVYETNYFLIIDVRSEDPLYGRYELDITVPSEDENIDQGNIIRESSQFMGSKDALLLIQGQEKSYEGLIGFGDRIFYHQIYAKGQANEGVLTVHVEEFDAGGDLVNTTNREFKLGEAYQLFEFEMELSDNAASVQVSIFSENSGILIKRIVGQIY